ncbi:PLP-dependent aminotransferase family protein [Actinomadura sp. WMMB 499]|uniref:MocR-like pyridoxine biosynthesis transcription factor PdxR n=1 Tax=Actinomadura sp. WMMB 499 TaxID=1219491 RepID=UPI00124427F7|nr:PLP-dependent aminotransferase family protein [Actinomadura sp. WMMB 499]QFG24836.1 PLP-dependent aminotransferase family protein [Actinomadura sp. WMMB 499]
MTDLQLPLDRSAGRLAAQLAAGLRAGVRSGRLGAGTRLPSSRDLARDLAVSRGVVVAAYEQLTAEGFLIARRGDGTRIAPLARPDGAPAPPAPPAPRTPADYDLSPGRPDLAAFPRDRWLAAERAGLRALPDDALAYPDPAGAPVLRGELAGYLGRARAAHTDPDRVVITNGVTHALSALIRLLRADGHTVLAVEDPASVRQLPVLQATGVRLVRVPVDGQGLDVAALARTDARAVLVTPAHQYPTGAVLSPARRAELVAWARRADGLILEDDYDAEFRYDREPVGCLQGVAPDRVVLLGSVSRTLAPAIRLGWAAVPPPLAARLRMHRLHTDLGPPVLPQYALAEYLRGGGYDRHLRGMRRRYRVRRDALADAIRRHVPGARVHGVPAGIHLYVELPPGCDEDRVIARASRDGLSLAGARPMWSPGRAAHAPSALVLGFAGLGEGRLVKAAELLGQAVAPGTRG